MNADEARIMNQSRISSPPSVPLYYVQATSEGKIVGLNSANVAPVVHSQGLSGSQIPMSVACPSPPSIVSPSGNLQSPSFTVQSSDDGGEDSVSGRKVKFLCSSGGKVMPRPSDGMLRYVGGQTRIITVKRDVSFVELAQKMMDDCGQHVVVKYQLPDEDLDALVSVSCPDDLENMMDEYDKLLERSPDGSVKLRVFLFSDSEVDSSGLLQFGDLQDNGRKYVDAVNGVMTRKESFASVASTQNSDLSIVDPVGNSLLSQDDVSGPQFTNLLSPTSDISARSVSDNHLVNPPEDSEVPSVVNVPAPSLQLQGLMDFHQDTISCTEYQKPAQLMYTTAPKVVTTPQPLLVQSPHFIPVTHMNMTPPSSNISVSPGMFPTIMQSQRLVAVPSDLGYNVYQGQVPGPGGLPSYGWNQENIQFSTPHQQLPHAHSDPVVQKVSAPNPDVNPVYHSLRVEDIARFHPVNNVGVHFQTDTSVVSDNPRSLIPQGIMGLPGQVKTNYVAANTNADDTVPQMVLPISHRAMPINGRMEQLQIGQRENPFVTEQIRSPVDQQHIQHMAGKQQLANVVFSNPAMTPEANANHAVPAKTDPQTVCTNKIVPVSMAASNLIGNAHESANWVFLQDSHFPPPRPSKIMTRKEAPPPRDILLENMLANGMESNAQAYIVDPINQPPPHIERDHHRDQAVNKVASDHLNKPEVQATMEVSASAMKSNVDASACKAKHDKDIQNNGDAKMQAKLEGINGKPVKANPAPSPSDERDRLQIIKNNDLEELRELGSGTFGTVYHGKWRGTDVAIKRINERCFAGKPSEEEKMRDDFWNEASNLADLHHPNVVAFYGVVLDGPGGSVATVTEYMVNGSLRSALEKNERFLDKRKRLVIAMDVAFGMEYLHSRNIVHFDLKSDNLLVNLRDPHRPICKVGDLGLSKVKCQTLISGGVRGTLPWMAPELLNGGSSLVSEKVDVFSFGIVMWELLTGDEPYSDLHYGAIIGGIVSNTLRPPVPEHCDHDWKALMERCWSAEPLERPSFTQIIDSLRSMSAKIPSKGQATTTNTRANVQGFGV